MTERYTANDPGERLPEADWETMTSLVQKFNDNMAGAVFSPEKDMFVWSTKNKEKWVLSLIEPRVWQAQMKTEDGVFFFATGITWLAALERALRDDWDESGVEIDVL